MITILRSYIEFLEYAIDKGTFTTYVTDSLLFDLVNCKVDFEVLHNMNDGTYHVKIFE